MPDAWEELYKGLDPLVDDADGDLDYDRLSNYEEYVLGSDPTNRNDPTPRTIFHARGGAASFLCVTQARACDRG